MSKTRTDKNNVVSLGIVSLFNDLASEMIYPLLPLFLSTTLKAGPAVLGLIEGVAEATASGFGLFSGLISDRLQIRKPIFVFGYAFSNLVRPLIGIARSWQGLFALRFSDRLGKGLRGSPRDALLADSAPPEVRGMAFGFQRAMDHTGAIIGPIVATMLLGSFHLDLRTVFLFSAIPGIIAVLIVVFAVKEIRPAAAVHKDSQNLAFSGFSRPFYLYLAAMFIFTIGNSSDVFLLLKAKDAGILTSLIPLLWSILHISKALFSFLGGFVSDRVGRKPAIIVGWLLYAAVYLGFGHISGADGVWILFAVYGIFFGLTEGPQKAMVSDLNESHKRGSAYGLLGLAVSIAAFPASVLFGGIWSLYGSATAFNFGAVLAAVASLLMLFVPTKQKAA